MFGDIGDLGATTPGAGASDLLAAMMEALLTFGLVSTILGNPARSFGPDLVGWDFSTYWIYVVGPLTGALLAVGFAWVLRGPGGADTAARQAAEGVFGDSEDT